jgi:hypothetical protein
VRVEVGLQLEPVRLLGKSESEKRKTAVAGPEAPPAFEGAVEALNAPVKTDGLARRRENLAPKSLKIPRR